MAGTSRGASPREQPPDRAPRGRLVKSTGDGVLAVFDGRRERSVAPKPSSPTPSNWDPTPVPGLHAGEIELLGYDIAGISVHIAAWVMRAVPGEVLVSRTIKDLVAGTAEIRRPWSAHPPRSSHECSSSPPSPDSIAVMPRSAAVRRPSLRGWEVLQRGSLTPAQVDLSGCQTPPDSAEINHVGP